MKQVTLSDAAMQALLQHPWQGNTRELENTLRTLVILSRGKTIGADQLPDTLSKPRHKTAEPAVKQPARTGLEAAEYTALLQELRNHEWNISATAKALGMSRNTLYRRMEKYAINHEQDQLD
jgi:transcriptional regulator of acetoin/glycerol metabolism